MLSIAVIIQREISVDRLVWGPMRVVHLVAVCLWMGLALTLVSVVLMAAEDGFLVSSPVEAVSTDCLRIVILTPFISAFIFFPAWRRGFDGGFEIHGYP